VVVSNAMKTTMTPSQLSLKKQNPNLTLLTLLHRLAVIEITRAIKRRLPVRLASAVSRLSLIFQMKIHLVIFSLEPFRSSKRAPPRYSHWSVPLPFVCVACLLCCVAQWRLSTDLLPTFNVPLFQSPPPSRLKRPRVVALPRYRLALHLPKQKLRQVRARRRRPLMQS